MANSVDPDEMAHKNSDIFPISDQNTNTSQVPNITLQDQ